MSLFRRSGFNCRRKRSSFQSSQMKFMCLKRHTHRRVCTHTHTQSHTCPERVTAPPQGASFSKAQTDCSGSVFVALIFVITVMCSDDCEWHWACLFSCNCLFPTEISMSDPLIVLIITCLIFCLPEKAHHSAFGTVGIDYGAQCGFPLQADPQAAGLSGAGRRNSGL